MDNYLHGVETVIVNSGVTPISVIKTAVVGLVGIAPAGTKNEVILVTSRKDAAQFGALVPGFNIPQALEAIFAQGPATVLVVNVMDDVANTVAVTDEVCTVENGKFKTEFYPASGVIVKNEDGTETYVKGTDYDFDAFGNFKIIGGAIIEGEDLQVSYKKLDGATVVAAQLVGGFDAETGVRTGLRCFELALTTFGINPKLLIAPGYTGVAAVRNELAIMADKFRAFYILDQAVGATVSATLADRGPAGTIFNTSDQRAILCYPHLKAYDPATDGDVLQPYSQFLAGIICAVDNSEGYHVSPSNHEIKGITGTERPLTAAINDPQSEVNTLNAAGITTMFNAYGTGRRNWGNRNASFPANADPLTFIPVLRTSDVVAESIEYAMLPFADKPLNMGIIDSVKETVNEFLRTLIGRGALIDGKCIFDKAANPNSELAAGHVTFDYSLMPPPPMERMTFRHFIDINLLNVIK